MYMDRYPQPNCSSFVQVSDSDLPTRVFYRLKVRCLFSSCLFASERLTPPEHTSVTTIHVSAPRRIFLSFTIFYRKSQRESRRISTFEFVHSSSLPVHPKELRSCAFQRALRYQQPKWGLWKPGASIPNSHNRDVTLCYVRCSSWPAKFLFVSNN